MKSARAVALLVAVGLLAGGVVASSAFTTATMDRDAGIDVVSDDTGVIALSPGPDSATGGVVDMSAGGELQIDFAVGSATGVNPDATFELGDSGDATNAYAFDVTNLDAESHDITLSYTDLATDNGDNVQFEVFDDTGSSIGTVTEEGSSVTLSGVASGETHYVVLTVDTIGLTNSSDLSGTLSVSI